MYDEPRQVNEPLNQFGAMARIEYQPLGIIGIVAPWNAPIRLIFHRCRACWPPVTER